MDQEAINRAAELFRDNRLKPIPLAALPDDCRPGSESDAYRIQEALAPLLTAAGMGPVAGYKIGCTTPVMQAYLEIDHPCAGHIFGHTVGLGEDSFPHARFHHVGVECELAANLVTDLPAANAPYDRQMVAAAVGGIMAAIEVVDDRYADFRALDAPSLVADDFFGAGCVLGSAHPLAGLDPAALEGSMAINGEVVGTGLGRDILGHPLEALVWLANARAERDRRLRAGDFVLLGSRVETKWVAVGDVVEIDIQGLGTATARFPG
jgi:2-oxo-3-hexenedioate decarboxylase/2-keto-4-pentenoate hydratase